MTEQGPSGLMNPHRESYRTTHCQGVLSASTRQWDREGVYRGNAGKGCSGKGAQCPHINPAGMCCCLALSWWPHGIMKISTVTATTNKRTHGIVAHVSIMASDLLQDAPAAGHTCCQMHLLWDAPVAGCSCCRTHLLWDVPAMGRTCCRTHLLPDTPAAGCMRAESGLLTLHLRSPYPHLNCSQGPAHERAPGSQSCVTSKR